MELSFKCDAQTAARVKGEVASAVLKAGVCRVKIEGESPAEVASKAEEILRIVSGGPSGSKRL